MADRVQETQRCVQDHAARLRAAEKIRVRRGRIRKRCGYGGAESGSAVDNAQQKRKRCGYDGAEEEALWITRSRRESAVDKAARQNQKRGDENCGFGHVLTYITEK